MGVCYYYGEGVRKDRSEAVKWYHKSAGQGDALAQVRLGLCYEPGKGVTKDRSEAVKWYQKAAARGNKEAQERLSK